jgi:hypothetical protein
MKIIKAKSQFELDLDSELTVNNNITSHGWWNLITSIRDVKLYQSGIKISRHWKITDVKRYFGIKGNKESVLAQLNKLKDKHFPA